MHYSLHFAYVILWNAGIVLQTGDIALIVSSVLALLLIIIGMAAVFNNYLLQKFSSWQRVTCGIAILLLLAYVFTMHWLLFYIGIVVMAVVLVFQYRLLMKSRVLRAAEANTN